MPMHRSGGLAGGADILIPEIPFSGIRVEAVLTRSKGRSSALSVWEGAKPAGSDVVKEMDNRRTDPVRLGGIGELVAKRIEQRPAWKRELPPGSRSAVAALRHPTELRTPLALLHSSAARGEFGDGKSAKKSGYRTAEASRKATACRWITTDLCHAPWERVS
jgi:hypothetical protein